MTCPVRKREKKESNEETHCIIRGLRFLLIVITVNVFPSLIDGDLGNNCLSEKKFPSN